MASDKPLITHVYTADPSAHVFNDRLYIYPSHDVDAGVPDNDNGDQYAMNDYHTFSLSSSPDDPDLAVTDHGVALAQAEVPWVSKQLWAPDAATRNGRYYLYFPARDKEGIFRIGIAESDRPEGPFKPDADYIKGTYSIDPAVFVDDTAGSGEAYLLFGGIWGGQLQCWQEPGVFDRNWEGPQEPKGEGPALSPKIARLEANMHDLAEEPKALLIVNDAGRPIAADDHDRRFFEAAWMHKYQGRYYFSYSTGDTHYLAYATSDNPYGPFTYQGRMLEPVLGWTTHHSIVEYRGKWWLFHHDASLSGGKNHLRSVKVKQIHYDESGLIKTITP